MSDLSFSSSSSSPNDLESPAFEEAQQRTDDFGPLPAPGSVAYNVFQETGHGLLATIRSLVDGRVTTSTCSSDLAQLDVPLSRDPVIPALMKQENYPVLEAILRDDKDQALLRLLSGEFEDVLALQDHAFGPEAATLAQLCCISNAHRCLVVLHDLGILTHAAAKRSSHLAPGAKNPLLYLAVKHQSLEAFVLLVTRLEQQVAFNDWPLRDLLFHAPLACYEEVAMRHSLLGLDYITARITCRTAGVTPDSTDNGGWDFATRLDQEHNLRVFPQWNRPGSELDSTLRELLFCVLTGTPEAAAKILVHLRHLATRFASLNYHLNTLVPYYNNRSVLQLLFQSDILPTLMQQGGGGEEFVTICRLDPEPLRLFLHVADQDELLRLCTDWPVLHPLLCREPTRTWLPTLGVSDEKHLPWICSDQELLAVWDRIHRKSLDLEKVLPELLRDISPRSYIRFFALNPQPGNPPLPLTWSHRDL